MQQPRFERKLATASRVYLQYHGITGSPACGKYVVDTGEHNVIPTAWRNRGINLARCLAGHEWRGG